MTFPRLVYLVAATWALVAYVIDGDPAWWAAMVGWLILDEVHR